MNKNGERLLSLLIFQKLKKELSFQEEDLSINRARRLLIEAISLHPDLTILSAPDKNRLIIRTRDSREAIIDLRNATDSLIIIWNEYIRRSEAIATSERS